ncbi:RNA-binding domain-containing protein [Hymenopellis radicata]|nr:RNA-binding domain-containing protein [Hymenopellis radicata]
MLYLASIKWPAEIAGAPGLYLPNHVLVMMFANLVRANARALATVSRRGGRSLSSRASIARPTLLHQTHAARRWMSDESSAQPRNILYLGNLPFNMEEDDIRNELQEFGVITNIHKGAAGAEVTRRLRHSRARATQRPSGWAIVQFETEEAAASVMRAQPFTFSGRTALIEWAEKQSVAAVRSEKVPSLTLIVANLSYEASERDVYEIFCGYGA